MNKETQNQARIRAREYYYKTKDHRKQTIAYRLQIKKKQVRKRIEMKEIINLYKKQNGCNHCGEKNIACLDFHHRDPLSKRSTINSLKLERVSWKILLNEISKCEVLCSNCHRKLHSANFSAKYTSDTAPRQRRRYSNSMFTKLKSTIENGGNILDLLL